MKNVLLTLFLLLSFSLCLQAQNRYFGPSISYQYQKGNTLKTGIYYATDIRPTHILKIDATANFSWIQAKHAVIPELAVTYYTPIYYIGGFARAELTPYTVTPKVGLSLLTFFEVDFGYGFPIANKPNYQPIKGLSTSLRFNIPFQ